MWLQGAIRIGVYSKSKPPSNACNALRQQNVASMGMHQA
jgi:hypothetical protein